MVIDVPDPSSAMFTSTSPSRLLAMITNAAPAACAWATFQTKVQVPPSAFVPPRLISAIFPLTAEPLVNAAQPSAGLASTMFALIPASDRIGPNRAAVAWASPAIDVGEVTCTV